MLFCRRLYRCLEVVAFKKWLATRQINKGFFFERADGTMSSPCFSLIDEETYSRHLKMKLGSVAERM